MSNGPGVPMTAEGEPAKTRTRKPKKQRAPRVVKKREYQVCRYHGVKEAMHFTEGAGESMCNILEPIGQCLPTRADAIAYIDGLKTIGQDITYWIMCRIAIVSVEMKATLSVK